MRKRLFVAVAIVAVLAASCGNDDDDGGTAGGDGRTVTVKVDGKTPDFDIETLQYYPDAVTVRPGDTVKFLSVDTGEPHTVTLGTIIDEGLNAGKDLPEDTPEDKLPAAVKAMAEKLPDLLPTGPGDANQLSANPCFSDSAPTDTNKACAKQTQPEFTGKQAVFNSGYLPDAATFEVKLADNIAPGTYNFMCLLHRQGMTGAITVTADDAKAQTADQVDAAGKTKLDGIVAKLRPAHDEIQKRTAATATAGGETPEDVPAGLAEFGPTELSVPIGGTVTWSIFGPHSITFAATEAVRGLFQKAGDGTWHFNEKAGAAANSPEPPPPPDEGSAPNPNAKPFLVDGGTFDGSTLKHSGIILSFGPPGYQYRLKFSRAGTYEYLCVVHPDMEGTVKVG